MEAEQTHSGELYAVLGWLEQNRKQVITGAVVVAVAVIAYMGYQSWSEHKEVAAGEALSTLLLSGGQGGVSGEDLLKVANDHPGTEAGARALITAAGKEFADGKTEDAAKLFQRFLNEYEGNRLTPQAKLGIAVCLEVEGKTAEATRAFKEVVDRFPLENTAMPAKYSLARLYEEDGKLEQARDEYMELAQSGNSTYATEAGTRLTDLLQAHPNLKPTAPATTPAAVQTPAVQ